MKCSSPAHYLSHFPTGPGPRPAVFTVEKYGPALAHKALTQHHAIPVEGLAPGLCPSCHKWCGQAFDQNGDLSLSPT